VDTVCFPDAFGFLNYSLNKDDRRHAFRGDDLAIIQSVEFGRNEWEHFLGGSRWQGIIATRFFVAGFESFSDLRELILIREGKGLRTPDEVHSCLSVLNTIYVLGSLNVPEVTVRSEKGY
jgi:hypothetical protein